MVLVAMFLLVASTLAAPALRAATYSTRIAKSRSHLATAGSRRSGHASTRGHTLPRRTAQASPTARTARNSNRHWNAAPARPAPYRASRGAGHGTRFSAATARRLNATAPIAAPRVYRHSPPLTLPSVPAQAATLTASGAVVEGGALSRRMAVPSRMPPPMRGSLTSLERQNAMADAEGLERILDEDDLSDRIAHGLLVPLPASAALSINADLPEHHRYCRPWTARFLADLARDHAAQFHGPLEVSSAVRTVAYQKHLMGVNGNAAPAVGDIVSPHLTGATIDIAKKGLTRQEIGWMRAWLLPLQAAGKIDVEEEFQQSCFHITVYKSYDPARPASSVARAHKPGPAQPGLPQPAAAQPRPAQSRVSPALSDVAAGTPSLGR
jgi:hypothetical protein